MLNARREAEVPRKGGRTELLDSATGMPRRWGPHCSQYFRAVMRQFKAVPAWTNEYADADSLATHIQTKNSDWTTVDLASVQGLANEGVLVVGIIPGHVGFAFPLPPKLNVSDIDPIASGPFVRDGNEHPVNLTAMGHLFPSTWGAIKTSRAFGDPTKVKWFKFVPSIPTSLESAKEWLSSWTSSSSNTCAPINPAEPAELDDGGCALKAVYACQEQCDAKWSSINNAKALYCGSACKVAYNCCMSPPKDGTSICI